MYTLHNKVIVITGASSGIGMALALEAQSRGALIAVCARNSEKLLQVYGTNSEKVFTYKADVSKEEECKKFITQALLYFGRIDVLINNAGNSMRASFEELDLKVLHELMDLNFWGAVNCTKYALENIIKNKGSIVAISSIAGRRGLPLRTGYSSSKFAMEGFFESLRTELIPTGVNILVANPGFTASNIRNTALTADGTAQSESPLEESKLMSAEECARIILNGVEKRKRTIVMTTMGKLTVILNKLFPKWMDKQVYGHFEKEKNSSLEHL